MLASNVTEHLSGRFLKTEDDGNFTISLFAPLKWALSLVRCTKHESDIAFDVSVPGLEHATITVTEELANDMCVGAGRQLPVRVTVAKRISAELWHYEFDF